MTPRILFILKRRPDFDPTKHSPLGLSTGLFNSASFMDQMLRDAGFESKLEVAIDNNCIDRMVTAFQPTHVIIEALWVVPTKFDILTKLHPDVKWIIRLHSEMPFIASEGIAMDWLGDYVSYPQISIGVNAPRILNEVRTYLSIKKNWDKKETNERIFYLPNYYPTEYKKKEYNKNKYWIDIACFGAVRPLKNHLLQAFAAIKFAENQGKQLRFHINTGRIEMKGDPIMNNLKGLFEHMADRGHQMICHEWTPREEFLEICANMDIGMQCNFSETFNIVSADLISQGVPILSSREIPWASKMFNSNPTECEDMVTVLTKIHHHPKLNVFLNQHNLTKYTKQSRKTWIKYFKGESNRG
jgi:hypothetical protein